MVQCVRHWNERTWGKILFHLLGVNVDLNAVLFHPTQISENRLMCLFLQHMVILYLRLNYKMVPRWGAHLLT